DLGDGFTAATALNMNSFRGKILRMNPDGSAPIDNPFYDASDGVTATDYIYAYGFRNPFGAHWRMTDGTLYEVENGPDVNDRFARVEEGQSYGWDGTAPSMATKALYNWTPCHAPVDIAFVEPEAFGGSGFPDDVFGDAFVTESGPTWSTGPQLYGKRIVRFDLDPTGHLVGNPHPVVEYGGSGKASASAIAAGPDGLYFADLYKDQDYEAPSDRGANILRITFVGIASFDADAVTGLAPLTVHFADRSNVPDVSGWLWAFGDGATSTEQNPSHTYAQNGVYNVRLRVTGLNGVAVTQRNGYVLVGNSPIGLRADYYNGPEFTGISYTRIDPTIDFDWGEGGPIPGVQADNFSVRWTGQLKTDVSGVYTFYATADDGVRLWVNSEQVIDRWIDQSPTEYSGTIQLKAGQRYNVKMEYFEHGGGAVAKLNWAPPGRARSPIPQSHLYPVTGDVLPPQPPLTVGLAPNYPNPFSDETNVSFAVPTSGQASLVLYNILGQEVRRLFDGVANSDQLYEFKIKGAGLSSGLYFLRLNAGGETFTQRLVHVGPNQ
ncbi:MAG TPA: PA14 domain-containing protein, partial [Rhodothermales bacterium]|nr:PA14 domain-containing protein [Rhodothermales bacterium]